MHLTEKQIRAYHDRMLAEDDYALATRHFNACTRCTDQLRQLQDQSNRVQDRLSRLDAVPAAPLDRAYARLQARLQSQQENQTMTRKIRSLAIPLAAALVVLVLFAVPSVRAAAIDFLGLFRVEQIEVVPFNPANLPANMEGSLRDYEALLAEQFVFSGGGDPVEVATVQEASDLAGFPVRVPDGVDAYVLTYQPAAQAVITVDLAVWQAVIEQSGRPDLALPAELDGAQITIDVPNSVTITSGDCAAPEYPDIPAHQVDCLVIVQMPAPSIEAPPGLPVDEVGQIFLQFFGLTPEEAAGFSSRIDWSTTLVLPIPASADYREVRLGGVPAVLFTTAYDSQTLNHSLIWVDGGILHALMLNGIHPAADAIGLAESLQD